MGLGVYTFADTLAMDTVMGHTFTIEEDLVVTFVKHDSARNRRLVAFAREIWILFLDFPLDYQTSFYVNRACEDFGQLTVWHNPRANKKYVLVKALIVDPKFVPKSIVMQKLGGARNSWSITIIMLRSSDWNAHIHHFPPPTEDPEPENGNPHPMHGEFLSAEQIFQQQLAAWLQQNGAQNVQVNHQGHQHVIDVAPA